MKIFKSSIAILITILVLTGLNSSCVKGTDPEQTEMELLAKYLAANNISEDPKPSGLYYLETEEGSGPAPVKGNTVTINYIGKDLQNNVFDTNIEEKAKEFGIYDVTRIYEPFRFMLGDSLLISGISEGVSYMKEGGTATLILPSRIAFQNYETVIYDVELLEVIDDEELKRQEAEALETYLNDNNITTEPQASGLYYIETTAGTGDFPQAGQQVSVHYTGKLVDGTEFDSSIGGQPISFSLGQGDVIPGWDEGIALMKKGGKATLIIPSSLGYGASGAGQGAIPPYSTLVFDVELVDIGL